MPPRRARKRRGKELVEAHVTALDETEEGASEAREQISPEFLETVIAELEHESERRLKKLKRAMGDMRQEFLNSFQVEMLKIPRKVREMQVGQFASVDEALNAAADVAKPTAKTPGGKGLTSRAPRLGETIMSVNGSPLAAVPLSTNKLAATIKVKHGPRSRLGPKEPNLFVDTGDGCVNLVEPDALRALATAPGDLKASTIAQLQSLQSDIASVMKTLQG